ncbi:ORF6N domain-containing protein [Desulfonatronospira sp.]|uniref:ORF6N domain-containing protein n=1 Tax=Desulfonatronospira sp. TaxID=1962951 RepID=UPI0025C33433|nr:ORF6N domain-containing protein [Desulfonatronospira sp.]
MANEFVPDEVQLRKKIHTLRGEQVMLDRDLADLYGVKAIRLREQVKRNIKRFPEDFMFQLTEAEVDLLVSQNAIPSRKHLGGSLPYAFTEQGVAGISGVLTSDRAIQVNIAVMRAFVRMRRFLAANAGLLQRMDTLEQRQISQEISTDKRFKELFDALEEKSILASQGVFFNGQVFDAYVFVNDLLRQAESSIVLIDNYIDDSVLMQLSKRHQGVNAIILTKNVSQRLLHDLQRHNSQYPPVSIQEFTLSHDRFLILDGETVYHIGASLKDLGKKWFAFSRMDNSALTIMQRVEEVLRGDR